LHSISKDNWKWQLLLAGILICVAASMVVATKRVDYTWHWERVPGYFFYHSEDVEKAPFDGLVTAITQQGELSTITVKAQDGELFSIEVETAGVVVKTGEELFEGDILGSNPGWHVGPLVKGLWTTIWISFLSGILGMVLGLVTGLCRVSKNPTLRGLSVIYIEIVRGTPLLVQIFIFYFFVGTVLNLDRLVAGVCALAIFSGAYVAEIIRAGIQSIPKGQSEAARSLGMNSFQTTHGSRITTGCSQCPDAACE
jgi:polar amino acid transport system permease protein